MGAVQRFLVVAWYPIFVALDDTNDGSVTCARTMTRASLRDFFCSPRGAFALVGVLLLVVTVIATPRSRRWEGARPLFQRPVATHPSRVTSHGASAVTPRSPPLPNVRRAPDATERRVFGALATGTQVGRAEVTSLEGLREGFLRVYARLPEGEVEVLVARAAGTNAHPPVSVGPYALYCAPTAIPHETLDPVLRAVAAALVVDDALVPPGLRPLIAQEPPR